MPERPLEYASPDEAAEPPPSRVEKWARIVLVIALAVGGLWVGLFLLHWISLGDMGH